ncbi:hypothetical protein RFI_39011 [Reticulomyxa filosa]|uniref:Uncharacterized protein n=1 Tax=Reticulomyxa filosa TaxID=46433 RepID=X6LAC9_RETFI|nr:hypothetical protein RFI_39011 [Reticulomyxa filosa]|eukprot:ETN98483.1 hypothetical protein RFI_39011 [Reticulomyxa filosa]
MASGDNTLVLTQLYDDPEDGVDEDQGGQEEHEEGHDDERRMATLNKEDTKRMSVKGKTKTKSKKMSEKDKDEFVADVIKEYLHLSASSVKIKFPLKSNAWTTRKKKMGDLQRPKTTIDVTITKSASSRSLLGNFFGLFGAKDEDKDKEDDSDNDDGKDDNDKMRVTVTETESRQSKKSDNGVNIGLSATSSNSNTQHEGLQLQNTNSNISNSPDNIEQILHDMDLDGILNDEEHKENVNAGTVSSASTVHVRNNSTTALPSKKNESNDRSPQYMSSNDNSPISDNSQLRKTARNAFSRALSRR